MLIKKIKPKLTAYFKKLIKLPKYILVVIALGGAGTVYGATYLLTSGSDPIVPVKVPLVSKDEAPFFSNNDEAKSDEKSEVSNSSDPNTDNQAGSQQTGSAENTSQESSNNTASGETSTGTNNGSASGGSTGGGGGNLEPPPPTNDPPVAPSGANVSRLRPIYADISFTRATDSDGIAKHELLRNGVVEKSSTSSSITKFRTNFVTEGSSYSYSVRAVDTKGAVSAASNSVTVNFPVDNSPPSLPTNFRVTENIAGSVTFAWNRSTDNYYTADESEIVYVISSPSNGSYYYVWELFYDYHQTYWFDEPGTTHNVYIQARDLSDNESAKVGPITFTAK